MDNIDLKYALGLPPEKAISYFKSKGYKFSWDWYEIWQESHAKAFTVAKVMRQDILDDIREMVQKSIDEGITYEQFRKELEPRLKAKGWWGVVSGKSEDVIEELLKRKLIKDGSVIPDGDISIKLGSPYRLKTIFRTNIQTAYMAGRYKEQAENTDNRPYWQYVSVMDKRTRPAHAILNGRIFRYDDPFWNNFYPPNGWGCRCRVRALSENNIQSRNLGIDSSEGLISQEPRLVSKKTGRVEPVAVYTDPLTGHKISPDVGWSYNPGRANWR